MATFRKPIRDSITSDLMLRWIEKRLLYVKRDHKSEWHGGAKVRISWQQDDGFIEETSADNFQEAVMQAMTWHLLKDPLK